MDDLKSLEDYAHERNVLFSSDAMRYFRAHTTGDELDALSSLIERARATFPSEDGWIVLNLDRITSLMGEEHDAEHTAHDATVIGGGSLAEAIVAGNLSIAYKLVEHRPMVALAEAASELDAIYRMYLGTATPNVAVSEELKRAVSQHSVDQLKAAIDALTSALDGAYTDEESAVKMAIMKATNIFIGEQHT